MEHCIVYFSLSLNLFRQTELIALLEQSRSHNAPLGITGILLINRGSIVQVLEGKKEVIEALYQRIENDQRHTDLTKLVDCSIRERSFPDWSMDCKSITAHQVELLKTIVDLGDVDWLVSKPSVNIIINMLKSIHQRGLHDGLHVARPVFPNRLQNHIQEWKQHYRHLAQAIQAVDDEPLNSAAESDGVTLRSSAIDSEQRMKEIGRLFDENRMLIWKRQQEELSLEYSSS